MGGGISFYGFSLTAWNKLDPKVQAFLVKEFDSFDDRTWKLVMQQTQEGINCDTGKGECKHGHKGTMTLHEPSPADVARAKKIAHDVVLPSWAARCGQQCVADWNATVGKVASVTAQTH
jgi:hypothetical protein